MRAWTVILLALLLLVPAAALAGEGDPLLSVDDLLDHMLPEDWREDGIRPDEKKEA